MQNRRDQMSTPDPSEDKPLRRIVLILLLVFVFVAIVFGIYQGIRILRTPDGEPSTAPTIDVSSPDFQATATAACEKFIQQFPGTPCPEQEP
jgi:hypothetical protein